MKILDKMICGKGTTRIRIKAQNKAIIQYPIVTLQFHCIGKCDKKWKTVKKLEQAVIPPSCIMNIDTLL